MCPATTRSPATSPGKHCTRRVGPRRSAAPPTPTLGRRGVPRGPGPRFFQLLPQPAPPLPPLLFERHGEIVPLPDPERAFNEDKLVLGERQTSLFPDGCVLRVDRNERHGPGGRWGRQCLWRGVGRGGRGWPRSWRLRGARRGPLPSSGTAGSQTAPLQGRLPGSFPVSPQTTRGSGCRASAGPGPPPPLPPPRQSSGLHRDASCWGAALEVLLAWRRQGQVGGVLSPHPPPQARPGTSPRALVRCAGELPLPSSELLRGRLPGVERSWPGPRETPVLGTRPQVRTGSREYSQPAGRRRPSQPARSSPGSGDPEGQAPPWSGRAGLQAGWPGPGLGRSPEPKETGAEVPGKRGTGFLKAQVLPRLRSVFGLKGDRRAGQRLGPALTRDSGGLVPVLGDQGSMSHPRK